MRFFQVFMVDLPDWENPAGRAANLPDFSNPAGFFKATWGAIGYTHGFANLESLHPKWIQYSTQPHQHQYRIGSHPQAGQHLR